jgi:hypothetical protein
MLCPWDQDWQLVADDQGDFLIGRGILFADFPFDDFFAAGGAEDGPGTVNMGAGPAFPLRTGHRRGRKS